MEITGTTSSFRFVLVIWLHSVTLIDKTSACEFSFGSLFLLILAVTLLVWFQPIYYQEIRDIQGTSLKVTKVLKT